MEALLAPLLAALEGWPVAAALRGGRWSYAAVNAAHIFGIALEFREFKGGGQLHCGIHVRPHSGQESQHGIKVFFPGQFGESADDR